jgi:glycosyltransferase involved in cell wall biosynthesis
MGTRRKMKVLIVDECMAPGGVETLRLNLVPELARLCESIVWALPLPYGAALRERIQERNIPNLVIENLRWPRGSIQQIQVAALRRVPRVPLLSSYADRLIRKTVDLRIRRLAEKHGSVCCLTTFVFAQPPPVSDLPLAGFVCDVNPILPEWIRKNIVRWAPAAQAIFGISEFTCRTLRLLAPDAAPKIHAVPIAAPPLAVTPSPPLAYDADFYFPAAANEHKDHLILFRACVELVRRGARFKLVLSGPGTDNFLAGGRFDKPAMEEARRFLEAHLSELDGHIRVVGNVTPAEVNALYNSARCVVLPCRYEGFGLPLVEALQRGKRILCSDIPAFREQLVMYDAMDRAELIPSGDAVRLADAMEGILKNAPPPPNDFAELNRRMARWTWADVARRCYDHLCSISMAT